MADVFRRQYRALTPEQTGQIEAVKDQAQTLLDTINEAAIPSPEMTLAQRRLEECVFWAVKAITG